MSGLDAINGMWQRQLQQARTKWMSPYPRFRRRADAGMPDSASPITYGYVPLSSRRSTRVPVPYHFEELERLSEAGGFNKQDWRPRQSQCPNCGARRAWVHPSFSRKVCDRCTVQYD